MNPITIEEDFIDADFDVITCPACRVCVPRGRVCDCWARTLGPCTENETRKILMEGADDRSS